MHQQGRGGVGVGASCIWTYLSPYTHRSPLKGISLFSKLADLFSLGSVHIDERVYTVGETKTMLSRSSPFFKKGF